MKNNARDLPEVVNTWRMCLKEDEEHSILKQMQEKTSRILMYMIHNVSLRFRKQEEKAKSGGLYYEFIENIFISDQLSSTRCLMDGHSMKGDRGVYSLKALLEDIKFNCNAVCREFYIEIAQLEESHYDIKKEDWLKKVYFDKFELISRDSVQNGEVVRILDSKIIDRMIDALDNKYEDLKEVTNKYYAHKASDYSRRNVKGLSGLVYYYNLMEMHILLYKITTALSSDVVCCGPLVPITYPFDVKEFVEEGLATREDVMRKLTCLKSEIGAFFDSLSRWGVEQSNVDGSIVTLDDMTTFEKLWSGEIEFKGWG